jgi:NDP-sugar pyrophosphorylase family protein
MNIRAVVLAAGKGTRLRPLTDRMPKVMVPVDGKPVLEYHIEQLARNGISEIFINLHYLPEVIKEYFSDGSKWGISIQYSLEPEIMGTAGAIKKLETYLTGHPFLVIYGDNLLEIDYAAFAEYSSGHRGLGAIAVVDKEDVTGCGILEIDGANRILRFKEKPKPEEVFSHWVNAGVYWLDPAIFRYLPDGVSDFSSDVFPTLLRNNERLYAYKLSGGVQAIDNLELLERLRMHISPTKDRP